MIRLYLPGIFCILILIDIVKTKDEQMELVQVLFRHGDRFPDEKEIPPIYESSFNSEEKMRYGQLTVAGMLRMYKFGKMLRNRYINFIDDNDVDKIYSYSTNRDRTRASLHMTLAGLFPNTNATSSKGDMRWLQIPINYDVDESNFLTSIYSSKHKCGRKLWRQFRDAQNSTEIQAKMRSYQSFWEDLKKKIGQLPGRPLCNYLVSLESMGRKLPDWCSREDYQKIKDVAEIRDEGLTFTNWSKRMTAGTFLEKFLENIQHNDRERKKMYLYSAHDLQITCLSRALQFGNVPLSPEYGSALIIEKYRKQDNELIRMFMWLGVTKKMVPVKLKNCNHECPLKTFTSQVDTLFPTEEDKKCE
ncbi:hypothetical protein QAD02_019568 [Eretmocerus hayati]|uniref:Uncharacterized protein n=1 Tax=Eretmocerus hayati TaxID=131215 RepID=A0ACC2PL57_9HYME|nr:hypothetical protein QAD02_019568 [Eretmocerus hayati]